MEAMDFEMVLICFAFLVIVLHTLKAGLLKLCLQFPLQLQPLPFKSQKHMGGLRDQHPARASLGSFRGTQSPVEVLSSLSHQGLKQNPLVAVISQRTNHSQHALHYLLVLLRLHTCLCLWTSKWRQR